MTLAELIHKALLNPEYRLALETGTLPSDGQPLSPLEIAAAAEVMRYSGRRPNATAGELFSNLFGPNVFTIGWRKEPRSSPLDFGCDWDARKSRATRPQSQQKTSIGSGMLRHDYLDTRSLASIEVEAQSLLQSLTDALPGDFGRLTASMIGAASTEATAADISTDKREAPADPIWWAPQVLALCCQVHGRPVQMAVPVGACFRLLGIVSAALDAVEDGHDDLTAAYLQDGATPAPATPASALKSAVISNAGTALIGIAWQALLEHGPRFGLTSEATLQIGRLITEQWGTICHAQHLDLTHGRSPSLTLDDYDRIIAGKAGAIGGTATAAGALLVGVPEQKELWYALGAERTIAQQLCDDYVDLANDVRDGHQIGQALVYALSVSNPTQHRPVTRAQGSCTGRQPKRSLRPSPPLVAHR